MYQGHRKNMKKVKLGSHMISPKLFGEVRFSEHSYSNCRLRSGASKQHGKVMMLVTFATWNQLARLGLATSKFPSSKSPFVANRICMFSQFSPENQWTTVPTLHLPVILRMRSASCTDGDGLRFSLSNWEVSFIPKTWQKRFMPWNPTWNGEKQNLRTVWKWSNRNKAADDET